jgi:hypothetical protein
MRLARDAGLEVRGAEQATRRELCEALEKFLPQGEAAATQALARAAPARRKGKLAPRSRFGASVFEGGREVPIVPPGRQCAPLSCVSVTFCSGVQLSQPLCLWLSGLDHWAGMKRVMLGSRFWSWGFRVYCPSAAQQGLRNEAIGSVELRSPAGKCIRS